MDYTSPVCGTIVAVVFSNPENGYSVIRLRNEDKSLDMPLEKNDPLICVGIIPLVAPGQEIMCDGTWITDSKYGAQFRIESCSITDPDTENDIYSYLSSGIIRGIGPATASLIVNRFGRESLDIIELHPEKLAEIKGISIAKAEQYSECLREISALRRLMTFLSEYGIQSAVALKLYRFYGDDSESIVRKDPYIISASHIGGSFRSADALALSLGFEADSHERIRAACIYELTHNLNNGHCFIPFGLLVNAASRLISVDPGLVPGCISELSEESRVTVDRSFTDNPELYACYLPELYDAERTIASRLAVMNSKKIKNTFMADAAIDMIEKSNCISYAPEQRRTLKAALDNRVLIITGGPGTGKTTAVRGIISLFEMTGIRYLLAAPTGRAAKRMSELSGREASTVHRLLGAQRSEDLGMTAFTKNEDDRLSCDAVILDEASMVDVLLMSALLKALPDDARIVCVGDVDQLPPVGPGRVFGAMINSGVFPTVRLTEIFRQSADSMIVRNAHLINKGEKPDFSRNTGDFYRLSREDGQTSVETVMELCARRLPEKMHIPSEEIQVLTPSRKGVLGTYNLNRELQAVLNPSSPDRKEKIFGETVFREGDRVMQIRNNYDLPWKMSEPPVGSSGIYNGDIGYIRSINMSDELMEIDFDGRITRYPFSCLSELEHAWAVTVHKSQGSEFRAVVLALSDVSPLLLTRSVLYTAVTRACDLLVMVGTDRTANLMIDTKSTSSRYTYLRQRIMRESGIAV